jgi:hypothetical protein
MTTSPSPAPITSGGAVPKRTERMFKSMMIRWSGNLLKGSWMWISNLAQACWSTWSAFFKKNKWSEVKEDWKQFGVSVVKTIDWWVDTLTTLTSETAGAILEGKARALQKIMPKAPDATSKRYGKTLRHLSRGILKFVNWAIDTTAGTALITIPDLINNISWQIHQAASKKNQNVIPLPIEFKNAIVRTAARLWKTITDPFKPNQEIRVKPWSATIPDHENRTYSFTTTKRWTS